MSISNLLWLIKKEFKENYKMLLLALMQLIFIFLTTSFLYIASETIDEGVTVFEKMVVEKIGDEATTIYSDFFEASRLIKYLINALFVLVAILGISSFLNLNNVIIAGKHNFFARMAMNGISIKCFICVYLVMLQIVKLLAIIISFPVLEVYANNAKEIIATAMGITVDSLGTVDTSRGIMVVYIVCLVFLIVKWTRAGYKLKKESLMENIDGR